MLIFKRFFLSVTVFLSVLSSARFTTAEDLVVPLWSNGAPGFEERKEEPELAQDYWVRNIHNPSITVFLPPAEKATGAGVVVIPGGGHRLLVFDAEGRDMATFLNKLGVAAFVLKHRLAREEGSPYKIEVHAKQDAYRALRTVRHRAKEWGVDPQRLGVLGFSAGGETAALVAYETAAGDSQATDPIERESGRPDFQIIVYPGPLGVPKVVPASAPPAFLLCALDDRGHIEPTLDLLTKYHAAGVPVEAHLYARGGHGFNMGQRSDLKSIHDWPTRLADWLADSGWLSLPKPQP